MPSARTQCQTTGVEGVMQTEEKVAMMCQLLERGWSKRRIARELVTLRHTMNRYLSLDSLQPYESSNRASQLDGH